MNLGVLKIFYVEQTSNLIGREAFEAIVQEQIFSWTCFFCRKLEEHCHFHIQEKRANIESRFLSMPLKPFTLNATKHFGTSVNFFFKNLSLLFSSFYDCLTCKKHKKIMNHFWDFVLLEDEWRDSAKFMKKI